MDATANNRSQPLSFFKLYLWCLSYLKPYAKLFILFLFCGLFGSVTTILVPKFVQIFVDSVLPNHDTRQFSWIVGIIAVMVVLMFIANAAKNTISQTFQEKAARDLQISIFRKMRELGFAYFEKHSVGETLSFFHSDIPAVQEIYRNHMPRIAESLITLVFSFVFLTTINGTLALIFIPCTIFYVIAGPYFEKRGVEYIREHNGYVKEIDKKQYDSLAALLELRVYGAEQWDLRKLSALMAKASRALFLHFVYINLYAVMRRIAVYGGAVLLFVFGCPASRTILRSRSRRHHGQ